MVGDAINPCPRGATGIVLLETPPQLEVNVLAQVASLLRIGFVGSGEPFKRRAELVGGVRVEVILAGATRRNRLGFFHT